MTKICDFVPRGSPLLIFSRTDLEESLAESHAMSTVDIRKATPSDVLAYLREEGVPLPSRLTQNLESGTLQENKDLLELLTVPLYLDFAAQTLKDPARRGELEPLLTRSADDLRDLLAYGTLVRSLEATHYQTASALRWLNAIVSEMSRQHTRAVAWWRIVDAIPDWALPLAAALFSAPAYLIALSMPVGLTRGLAIGLLAAVVFGISRGRPKLAYSNILPAALTTFATVSLLGWWAYGDMQAIVDAAELSVALGFACLKRRPLMLEGRLTALRTALMGGILIALITTLVSRALGYVDPNRNFVSLLVAGFFGLGIAVVSARVFMSSKDRMLPSRVTPSTSWSWADFLYSLRAAMTSPLLIGLGGGVGGALRGGPQYGLAVFVLFAVIIGVPVGLMGGIILWLSSPSRVYERRRPWSTLRVDRAVAVGSVLLISVSASVGIAAFETNLQQVSSTITALPDQSFDLHVVDGILFGIGLGMVVACIQTAWVAYFVAVLYLGFTGKTPFFLAAFLKSLESAQILRREGSLLEFRHDVFREALCHRQELSATNSSDRLA